MRLCAVPRARAASPGRRGAGRYGVANRDRQAHQRDQFERHADVGAPAPATNADAASAIVAAVLPKLIEWGI